MFGIGGSGLGSTVGKTGSPGSCITGSSVPGVGVTVGSGSDGGVTPGGVGAGRGAFEVAGGAWGGNR